MVFWLYQKQDMVEGAMLRDVNDNLLPLYDWLPCPAHFVKTQECRNKKMRGEAGEGAQVAEDVDEEVGGVSDITDGTCQEVFLTAHEDELLPAQIIHPAVVHWLPGGVKLRS